MNKKYVIANWKNTKTNKECVDWIQTVGPQLESQSNFEIVVCPPFLALDAVHQIVTDIGYGLKVGSQSVSSFDKGAYTGEIGAFMLEGIVEYALIGHSERRSLKHETNEDVQSQVAQCVAHKINPVVLVRGVEDAIPENVGLFAWEPVSAIGTGQAIEANQAGETIAGLRQGRSLQGIYGGSVNSANIASFMQHPEIAGVLIGSASNDPTNFLEMIHALR